MLKRKNWYCDQNIISYKVAVQLANRANWGFVEGCSRFDGEYDIFRFTLREDLLSNKKTKDIRMGIIPKDRLKDFTHHYCLTVGATKLEPMTIAFYCDNDKSFFFKKKLKKLYKKLDKELPKKKIEMKGGPKEKEESIYEKAKREWDEKNKKNIVAIESHLESIL